MWDDVKDLLIIPWCYAYWLAAGFPVDADEAMIENVITLFCEENLAEMQADEAA